MRSASLALVLALALSACAPTPAHKAARVEWFPLSALPDPMVPHEAYALSQLSSGAVYLTFGF